MEIYKTAGRKKKHPRVCSGETRNRRADPGDRTGSDSGTILEKTHRQHGTMPL